MKGWLFLFAMASSAMAAEPSRLAGAVELQGGAFPSSPTGTPEEGQVTLAPILDWRPSSELALTLAPVFRVELAGAGGTRFRREDWDELSDYGQLIPSLRAGGEDAST